MRCTNCNYEVDDNQEFCTFCGQKIDSNQKVSVDVIEPNQNTDGSSSYENQGYQTETIAKPVVNTTPFLIWSIVNLVCCCLPLGIAGIVFVVKAGNATTQEEADKAMNTAKTLNIVGMVVGALIAIIWLISTALLGVSVPEYY